MKFVQTTEYVYSWPMNVKLPHPDKAGHWKVETFRMQFAAVPNDRAKEIIEEIAALKPADREARQHDSLLEAARGWEDVVDENKQPIPFSREMLLEVLNAGPWYRDGIYKSWWKSLQSDEARLGN